MINSKSIRDYSKTLREMDVEQDICLYNICSENYLKQYFLERKKIVLSNVIVISSPNFPLSDYKEWTVNL